MKYDIFYALLQTNWKKWIIYVMIMPMTEEFLEKIKQLLKSVLTAEPDFYRKKYADAGIDSARIGALNESNWTSIPILTKPELVSAPYKSRCYGEKSGLNKLVFSQESDSYFLIHRTLEEIREEKLPYEGTRPMAIFENVYEAIERCLYFYERNLLPLIGEFHNSAVIYATARQYEVDTIFMDRAAIHAFRAELLKILPALKSVTVIDDAFSQEDFAWPEKIKLNFSLSIPEIGSIAHACPVRNLNLKSTNTDNLNDIRVASALDKDYTSNGVNPESILAKNLVFHPADDVYIEPSALSVISTTRLKACPIIRYQSALYMEKIQTNCGCKKASFKI